MTSSKDIKYIYFASSNKDKLKEIKSILHSESKNQNVRIIIKSAPKSFKVNENGKTFIENAYKKASTLSKKIKGIAFSDDSGIEIFAMNRRPGIKSARFFRNGKGMLEIVDFVKNKKNKKCCFTCAIVATDSKGKMIFKTQKSWHGKVADKPKGKYGFGYDPIFIVPKLNKTSGELRPSTKDRLSHRYMATAAFAKWLSNSYISKHF